MDKKRRKTESEIVEEDQNVFKGEIPKIVDMYRAGFDGVDTLKGQADYLISRVPDGFITRELLFHLSEIESVSSEVSLSDEELNELLLMSDTEEMIEEINNKSVRELYYELMIEKNFHTKTTNIKDFDDITGFDDGVKMAIEAGDSDANESEHDLHEVDERIPYDHMKKPAGPSVMDSDSDDFNLYERKDHLAFITDLFPRSHVDKLLGDDIDCPKENIDDVIGCKSLKTMLDESCLEDESRLYAVHSVVCLFEYDNGSLCDNDAPIEQEITEMIHNLNHNTIKPADEMYSQIKGCVIVSRGLGILILEISLFDLIRMISSLNWSSFKQQVLRLRILSLLSYVNSRFTFFMTCRAFFDENDTRTFPDPEKLNQQLRKNNKKYLAVVQKCLKEISDKIGYTITLMLHQAETHLCGVGELPQCAAQHLPSRQLIEWALELSYLKTWPDLIRDIMVPEEFYDHTKDSYPAPTDMFNLKNLYIMDDFKEYLQIFYRKGFRPKFSETVLPQLIIPEVCRPEAEEVFKGKSLLFVEYEDEERNFDKLQ